jgi:hypothetical protein
MTGEGVFIADLKDGCPAGTTPQALKAAWGTAGAAPPRSPGSAP